MFKVGDVVKGIKDSNDENMGTRLLKAEVIESICNGEELLLQILEQCDGNKVGIVFKTVNSKEYLKLVDDKIRIEDVELLIDNSYKNELIYKEEDLNKIKREKEITRCKFMEYIKEEQSKKIELKKAKLENSSTGETAKKIFEELQLIEKDEKCEKIIINSGIINIFTTQLYIEDEKYPQGHFKMNKYHIKIKLDTFKVNVKGMLSNYNRYSCWGDDCPHPHISNQDEPCWGNTAPMLIDTMNNKDLYTTFMVVINFLETFNIDDDAGKHIKNWDFVSIKKDEKILENPYSHNEQLDCGCDSDTEDGSIYYCHVCSNTVCDECVVFCAICDARLCSEHSDYLEYEEECVCFNCKDENYVYAEDIRDYVRKENSFTCHNCEKIYTTNYINYIDSDGNDKKVCDDCR